ncbi:MAG: C39 family peptidase [Candidatus Hadarchaeota archaeon]|nr:C39 family peptidase [Candidatus Hadarchaeota archaeon]
MRFIRLLSIILILCAVVGYALSAVLIPSQTSSGDLYVWDGGSGPHDSATILNVPFVHQRPWYCSEASASMVLGYYGYEISQNDIHDMGYDRFEVMLPLLSQYVDCDSEYYLEVEDLKEEIDEEDPVMIRILLGEDRHTIVVVGYDEKYLYVHDPAYLNGENLKTDPEVLLDYWELTGFAAIVFSG